MRELVIREGLSGVVFMQRLEGGEDKSRGYPGKERPRETEESVQRPWGQEHHQPVQTAAGELVWPKGVLRGGSSR